MSVTIIAAMDENGLIGRNGALPWYLPDDLRRFKQLTMGTILLMGRKTYESLPGPLPGREHWVLSRSWQGEVPGVQVFYDVETALAKAGDRPISVVGGAEIYVLAMPLADKMMLTQVQAVLEGDVYFPEWSEDDWQEVASEEHAADVKHAYAFRFVELVRSR